MWDGVGKFSYCNFGIFYFPNKDFDNKLDWLGHLLVLKKYKLVALG